MDLQIKGKLALVTGSTQGIGKAIATKLLQEGVNVIINSRSQKSIDTMLKEHETNNKAGKIYGIAADISTETGAQYLAEGVKEIVDIDILINNVGFFEYKPFFEVTDADWSILYNLNVMSGVRLTRALMPKMLQKNWGRVVFIASEAGVKPNPDMLHYSVTKTAQIALARGLAEMTKGTAVTVNSALVAPTWTEGVKMFLDKIANANTTTVKAMKTDYFKADGANSLLQRFAHVNEIADLVVFLCSKNASAINGSAQRVDGGIIRSIL
jgi:NAD(P)-dependent dehydrogenase (short-subunit alcohol dehydrogenase family)